MPSFEESSSSLRNYVPGSFPSEPISPGFNAQRHLAQEVFERRNEYVKIQNLRIKIGSWNVAACPGTEKDIHGWFVGGKGVSKLHGGLASGAKADDDPGEGAAVQEARVSKEEPTIPKNDSSHLPAGEEIDIYALGLQEIIDINSAAEALRPFNDSVPATRWKDAVAEGLPQNYVLVAEQQLLGLLLLVYASQSIAQTISSISTTSVGTGLMGYMGNKGAVSARIILGETTKMVFINSHLAAGNDKGSVERRNWDALQILQRTRFAPIDHGHGVVEEIGEYIGEEDFAFWFGDLNYRLADIPSNDVRRLLLLHTRNEYDKTDETRKDIDEELHITEENDRPKQETNGDELDPSEDPASALTTISSLMTHDQLHFQMRTRKAFHQGWQEGPITFLPTYKYDVGSVGMFDSSEKRRSPSWCDRILYRTKRHYQTYLSEEKEHQDARKRDQEMKSRGLDKDSEDLIFDYDPEADGDDDNENERNNVTNVVGDSHVFEESETDAEAAISLEYYVSHQRVLSSDHKPLDAIFTIEYRAVDPDLKSKVHQEVAKEIDRQENEGRPSVTTIFESSDLHDRSTDGCHFGELRFLQEKVTLLTVANTSPTPASFQFLNKEGSGSAPSWLRIANHDVPEDRLKQTYPGIITLQPGDSANLEVIALVHRSEDLISFNEGISKPDNVLIMRVLKGRDHFIQIHADWVKTMFGLPLERFVRLGKANIRDEIVNLRPNSATVHGSAPRQLFRLTEALEESLSAVVAHEDALQVAEAKGTDWPFISKSLEELARDTHMLNVREALDTGAPINLESLGNMGRVEVLSQTMALLLSYMPGRIVSNQLWSVLSSSLQEHETSKQHLNGEELRAHVLDVFTVSPPASVSFTFLTFMLARIANELTARGKFSEAEPPPTPSTPRTPATILRGLSIKGQRPLSRRQQIETAFADRFVPLIFETDSTLSNTKIRRVEDERKKSILLAFLSDET